jgi:hypothetical protein
MGKDEDDRYKLSRSKKDAMLPSLRAPTDLIERVRKLCENSASAFPAFGVNFGSILLRLWRPVRR